MRAKSHADELETVRPPASTLDQPLPHAAPEDKPLPVMRLVKADLHELNAPAMIARGEFIVSKMTGNINFPTPSPALATVTTAIDALGVLISKAVGGAHEDIDARDLALVEVRNMLTALCYYVNYTSGADLGMAITSGFEPVREPAPITLLAPRDFTAFSALGFAGCIELKWRRVAGANLYHTFVCEGDLAEPKWTLVGSSTRARLRAMDLVPGKLYSFHVVALGASGVGPASEIVSSRAA